ncbi:3-oxoacyl-ACP reductase family protein [Enterobacter sp. Bisph1]|uniref:SDR family NAD(P)-dependent oxidoreductase n=1 Tax=Enterobacter sp. Bisph1 TaxID=1274399 RepID=UPI00057BF604|nr:3-oxoacyl-ACP reductase family protein [Enterobacter sp. Bisph1]
MSHSLAGKRALVTGASRGLGKAIALTLAREGADVAITWEKSAQKAQAVVEEIRAAGGNGVAIQADSANPQAAREAVAKAVEQLGGLDILVNNAGIARAGQLEAMSQEDIDALINVNIRGVIYTTQAAIPHLPQGGRIINIGSSLSDRVPFTDITVYSMTKSALNSLTRGLARDLGPRGITVNMVKPGSTDSDMNPADGENADEQRRLIALGHYGEAQDIAEAVAFLASPAAKQITGTDIVVDGGANA